MLNSSVKKYSTTVDKFLTEDFETVNAQEKQKLYIISNGISDIHRQARGVPVDDYKYYTCR